MRKKQILSVMLVIMIIICPIVSMTSVQGIDNIHTFILGDVNGDGVVSVKDATAIQRALSEFDTLSEDALVRAKVTKGEKLIISDATEIQRYLAEFENSYDIGKPIVEDIPSDKPQLIVENVSANPGDTNVAVTISVKNNPGIASLAFDVNYNTNALTLNDFSYNEEVVNGSSTVPFNANAFPTCLSMVNGTKNITGDWTFATLYFDVKDSAKGIYDISLTYDAENIYNIDENNIMFYVVTGSVQVTSSDDTTEPKQEHTVTFKDSNGSIIEEQIVKDGETPIYPDPPVVPGYVFKGWDKTIDKVTEDTVITAVYEPITDGPAFVIDNVSAKAGKKNVAVNVAVKNNPGIASILLEIIYDKDNLTLTNFTYNDEALAGSSTVPFNEKAFAPCLNMVNGTKNIQGDWIFATLYFDVKDTAKGSCSITVNYDEDNVYNIDEENILFEITSGSINVE